jgi:hypothetical protein
MLAYVIVSGLRYLLFSLIREPSVIGDEIIYKGMAYSYYLSGDLFRFHLYPIYPNYLYQVVISVCFYLKGNPVVWIKLMNALLLNASIFPAYFLAKLYVSERKAVVISSLILILPFMNLGNQIMTESLFIFLLLVSVYLSVKMISDPALKDAVLNGIVFSLLFLTKLQGLMSLFLFLALSVVMIVWERKDPRAWKKRAWLTACSLMAFLSVTVLMNWIFLAKAEILYFWGKPSVYTKGAFSSSFFMTAYASLSFLGKSLSRESINLWLGHLAGVLPVYLLPLAVMAFGLIQFLKERKDRAFFFLSFGLGTFVLYFILGVKYSIEWSLFNRIHARYYLPVYPILLTAFACFAGQIAWTAKKRIALALLLILTIAITAYTYFPNYNRSFALGSVADNPDTTWIRFESSRPLTKGLIVASLLALTCLIVQVVWRRKAFLAPYCAFFIFVSIIANIGHIKALKKTDGWVSRQGHVELYQRLQALHQENKNILIIAPNIRLASYYVYWHPEARLIYRKLPEGGVIKKAMVPKQTDVVVLSGSYLLQEIASPRDKAYFDSSLQMTILVKKSAEGGGDH